MTEHEMKPVEANANKSIAADSETALEDLQPSADVHAGFDAKATDVTLKRGVID
jgi:hypothetical protein